MHIGKAPTFRRLSRVLFIQQILNEELSPQLFPDLKKKIICFQQDLTNGISKLEVTRL